MFSPVVRPARRVEYDAIGELTVRAYLAEGPVGDYEREMRRVADRAAHGTVLVAAEPDGPPLGTVTLLLGTGPWRELATDGDAEMRLLAVDPLAAGRGIGTALTLAGIDLARDAHARRLVLSTQRRSLPAQRLYSRLGFDRRPDLDWIPRPGIELIGYVLDL